MKVGVIAGEMERRSTGVGRYLSGLLHGLSRWDHGVHWLLFFQGEAFDHPLWHNARFEPIFGRNQGRPILWEQLQLPWQIRNHRLDLLFCPAYSVPFGVGVPSVVTIHDLSFELLPREFSFRERWRRRLLARRACRVARRVLADTTRVAGELTQYYGLTPSDVGVVPLGIETDLIGGQNPDGDSPELPGVRRPYLLSVGTIFERRMPRLVLETVAELVADRPELQLVMAGDNRLRRPQLLDRWIAELGLQQRVLRPGWVPEGALPGLYRDAELSFYLSSYEGFGIPPLESLAFGTPPVVGPGLALDEIWPDYPYRIDSPTLARVVATSRRILDRGEELAATMAESDRVLAGADWEKSSRVLVGELERALER
jgi:glycosyltransferase involved in cell wall biosynthesis